MALERGPIDVLVVEDEPHVAQLLVDVLTDDGYRVAIASDGLRGLEYATRYRPRVVLSDVMLPGLSGIDLCRRLSGPPPRVILMSAGQCQSGTPPGVPFLAKPFDLDDLLDCVHRLLPPPD